MTTVTTYIILGEKIFFRKGENNMEILLGRKLNIRDTKRYYSELNNTVLNGLEMVTFKGINKNSRNDEEVSHIKTPYVDFLMGFLKFNPITESGEEVGGFTISLNEIDMYGEGSTIESAKEDLMNTICEYVSIYLNQINIFGKVESISKQVYMLKLIRCDGNRDKIMKEIGL